MSKHGLTHAVLLRTSDAKPARKRKPGPRTSGYGVRLTVDLVRQYFRFDPESGLMFWIEKPPYRSRVVPGDVAGVVNSFSGYLYVSFGRWRYLVHRVAWVLQFGTWPTQQIDHINQVKADNRLSNLREVTPRQNIANTGIRSDNTSGYKGVSLSGNGQRWNAFYAGGGRTRYLGVFDTPEEAHAAYAAAVLADDEIREYARVA